ncbi:radical SAM/SPASM domain-containing protein [Persicobacter sp. CCB-QB2]|uniref:radical SAM/SPASM domain-containing protein n=1 Tax=Persicobacter sp. CCB-QB2 TaxID=1561025 RepID=UPI000A406E95|nr:radical SAM/SPASM domain-containing protein [Persicobacter sp. CCB-QB2]
MSVLNRAKVADGWSWLKKLSLIKLINMVKVRASYLLSGLVNHPIHWGMPLSLAVEPTTSCNLRCPECPSGLRQFSRPTGMMDLKPYQAWITELGPYLTFLNFYFQGEPFLNRRLIEMIQWANQQKIYTATSTNAHYLDEDTARKVVESGLDRLIISVDGTDQQTYEQYRIGGKLEKVIAGTEKVLKWKKALNSQKPFVIFQFLVVGPNEHQIEEVKALGESLGVDEVVLKSAQIYDYEQGSDLIPKKERYSRYVRRNGKYELKHKMANHCWRLWHSPVVTWDGSLIPCCFDKDATYSFGQWSEALPLAEIWKGQKARQFKKGVLKNRQQIDICRNCTEGARVWF